MLKVKELPLSEISVSERARSDFGDLNSLMTSISEHGVLQPIVVDEEYNLCAGERRFKACEFLELETIPARVISAESASDKFLVELVENTARKDFSWSEEIELKLRIHEYYQEQKPSWSYRDTCKVLGVSIGGLSTDLDLAKVVRHFPELGKLKTKRKAMEFSKKLVSKAKAVSAIDDLPEEEQKKIQSMLNGDSSDKKPSSESKTLSDDDAAEQILTISYSEDSEEEESSPSFTGSSSPSYEVSSSDEPTLRFIYQISSWENLLESLPPYIGFAELDPPYAIDFTKTYYNASESESDADWTKEQLEDNLTRLFSSLYSKMLDSSWVLVWTGREHSEMTNHLAQKAGFSVQQPGIWVKPGGSVNRTQTTMVSNYETYVLLRKGQATFNTSHLLAAISYEAVHSSRKYHQWQKPLDLYKHFLDALGRKDTLFFSPFAGSGMSMIAACLYGMTSAGSELTQKYFYEFYQTISEYGHVEQLSLEDM